MYYAGTEEEWSKIVLVGNTYLTNATIHYNGITSDMTMITVEVTKTESDTSYDLIYPHKRSTVTAMYMRQCMTKRCYDWN